MTNRTLILIAICLLSFIQWGGSQNGAATFNDGKGAIEVENVGALFNHRTEMTLSAWVFPMEQETFNGILGVRSRCDFYLLDLNGQSIEARFSAGEDREPGPDFNPEEESLNQFTISQPAVMLNTWNHLALTYGDDELALYLNGELLETMSANGVCDVSSLSFFIGKTNSFDFEGQIDEVQFWTEKRSQQQIQTLMNTTIHNAASFPGLALYYPLDEPAGSKIVVNKGNAEGFDGVAGEGVNFTRSTAPVIAPRVSLQNVAVGKTARQSSTASSNGTAGKAIDGNTDGRSSGTSNSITQTNEELNPWWEVDLGEVYDISQINIWNRIDECCWDRLSNFYIMVSEEPITENSTINHQYMQGPQRFMIPTSFMKSWSVNARGRFVRVFIEGEQILSIAELEVMGKPAKSNPMVNIDRDLKLDLMLWTAIREYGSPPTSIIYNALNKGYTREDLLEFGISDTDLRIMGIRP